MNMSAHSMDCVVYVFLFNVPATTESYTYLHTLSLHDALPISLAADTVVDRELQLRAVAQHAVGARAPGLDDVPLLVAHRRPLHGELVAGLLHPPHVVAAGIDELHLQVVGWRIAAYFARERVVLRIVDRQVALDAVLAGHTVEDVVQDQARTEASRVGTGRECIG